MKTLKIYNTQEQANREKEIAFRKMASSRMFGSLNKTHDSIFIEDLITVRFIGIGLCTKNKLCGQKYDNIIISEYADTFNHDISFLGCEITKRKDVNPSLQYTISSNEDGIVTFENENYKCEFGNILNLTDALEINSGKNLNVSSTNLISQANVVYDKRAKRFVKERYVGNKKLNKYLDFIGK